MRVQGCIQDFFYGGGGGHTLVRPLGGLVGCSPRNFFVFYVRLWPNSGGGGGEGNSRWRGEIPVHPAPPLYATLVSLSLAQTRLSDRPISIASPRRTRSRPLMKAAGVEVEPIWPSLFAKALEGLFLLYSLVSHTLCGFYLHLSCLITHKSLVILKKKVIMSKVREVKSMCLLYILQHIHTVVNLSITMPYSLENVGD